MNFIKLACATAIAFSFSTAVNAAAPYCGMTSVVDDSTPTQLVISASGWHVGTPYEFDLQYKIDGAAEWTSYTIAQSHTNGSNNGWGASAFPESLTDGVHSIQVRSFDSTDNTSRSCGTTVFQFSNDNGQQSSCETSSNVAHVAAGRAYAAWGWAYATGSNELLGLNSIAVTKTLEEASTGYWEIDSDGSCQ